MSTPATIKPASPFVKWIGGKRQLLPQLTPLFPTGLGQQITRYAEPFVGGGAMFFHIVQNYDIKECYISDKNQSLISSYEIIKNQPDKLIRKLDKLHVDYTNEKVETRGDFYNEVRRKFNTLISKSNETKLAEVDKLNLSAYFIFLNKTCFNGLYRENSKGEFNSPHGRYDNPMIVDKENLLLVHNKLQSTEINLANYSEVASFLNSKTFLYVDPPYRPLNKTSSFTSYIKGGFGDVQQVELASFLKEQHARGVKIMLSNSDPHNIDPSDNFFDDLYSWANVHRVSARRAVNTKATGRGPVSEIVVTSY